MLTLAGRHADIVGITASLPEGRVTADTAKDLTPARVRQKVEWIGAGIQSAGRDPESVELSCLAFIVVLTDDPSGVRGALSKSTGMTLEEVADSPLFLTGSGSEIRERLEKRREETGISYMVTQGDDMTVVEQFAEQVVAPLAGR
jgi:alkanesulfonate monooxygenase SsuD/methylene tetrahydromethanopterin reductase-like flavin-dependent oxidoreductase (luciferase family)